MPQIETLLDDEQDELLEQNRDLLESLNQLRQLVERVPWFQDIGKPLTGNVEDVVQHYLDELGFPDARLAPLVEWEDALSVAESPSLDGDAWEAEEQLRAALSAQALELWDEEALITGLESITEAVSTVALREGELAASMAQIRDDAFIEAAARHAVQCAYHAALVLAAQISEDHPFALKFRLFELGRWPIGIVGRSFNLF